MRTPRPSDTLRVLLVATLGASPLACESSSEGANRSAPAKALGCTNPQPHVDGHDTGFVKCDEGYVMRTSAGECPVSLPLEEPLPRANLGGGGGAFPAMADECASNADCDHLGELGYCSTAYVGEGYAYLKCYVGCATDDDCGPQSLCLCGQSMGSCQPIDDSRGTGCRSADDCSDGSVCVGVAWTLACGGGYRQFACTPPASECSEVEGCAQYEGCELSDGLLTCSDGSVCGRPFLIEATDRKAQLQCRDDWVSGSARQAVAYTDEERYIAARHFERVALMEHASIAAFARFSLQLLSLGAPARFIEETNQALVDETKHTRLALDLVARFGGKNHGPGPLDVNGALSDASIESILVTTILEGCIGETLAALEAHAALSVCDDEDVRLALGIISADETRHATLAWKVVQWILTEHPGLRSLAHETFENGSRVRQGSTLDDQAAPRLGVLGKGELVEVHVDARENVILPCVQTLLAGIFGDQADRSVSVATAESLKAPLLGT